MLTVWLWDCLIYGRALGLGTTKQEIELWSTGAVAQPNGSGKLNAESWSVVRAWLPHEYHKTHKSPAVILHFSMNGVCFLIISSMPPLA